MTLISELVHYVAYLGNEPLVGVEVQRSIESINETMKGIWENALHTKQTPTEIKTGCWFQILVIFAKFGMVG